MSNLRVINADHNYMVSKLAKSGEEILKTLTPEKIDLWHHATGLATEAGELLDAAKRICIYDQSIDEHKENIIEELGDAMFYARGAMQRIDVLLGDVLQANMEKLLKRYPDYNYSDEAAKERKDKQLETEDE